jgi:hypothetical protein
MIKQIARNWRVKLLIQKLISVIPGNTGFKLNEFATQLSLGGIDERVSPNKRILKGIDNILFIRNHVPGFSLTNASVFEIGTGWHAIDLLLFFVLGTKHITTCDQHRHLNLANVLFSIQGFTEEVSDYIGEMEPGIKERINFLHRVAHDSENLDQLLEALNITYIVVQSKDYVKLEPPAQPYDLFFSESVLQRVPHANVTTLCDVISKHSSTDCVAYHRLDQKDINAQQHVDTGLWRLYYLKYSDWFYQLISTRFNSQNRLRESDFLELFSGTGWSTIAVESGYFRKDVEKLKSFSVAKRFHGKNDLDLATIYSRILLSRNYLGDPVLTVRQLEQTVQQS